MGRDGHAPSVDLNPADTVLLKGLRGLGRPSEHDSRSGSLILETTASHEQVILPLLRHGPEDDENASVGGARAPLGR